MPNPFSIAKAIWRSGDLEGSIASLNQALEDNTGRSAFLPKPRIFYRNIYPRFEVAVSSMLVDEEMLIAPFGPVFSWIWQFNPNDLWILVLLDYNFYREDDYSDYDEDEDLSDFVSREDSFSIIVNTLNDAALKGILAPDGDGPLNGRPKLRIESIHKVPASHWGDLKRLLLDSLPESYAKCPPDFWARLAADEPVSVVERFLYDLFTGFDRSISSAETQWKIISQNQVAYADAAQKALAHVIHDTHTPGWYTELVRVDAGFTGVDDGLQWLTQFAEALNQKNFESLEQYC